MQQECGVVRGGGDEMDGGRKNNGVDCEMCCEIFVYSDT